MTRAAKRIISLTTATVVGWFLFAFACVVEAPLVPTGGFIGWTKWNTMGSYSPTLTIFPRFEGRVLAASSGTLSLIGLHQFDAALAERFWQDTQFRNRVLGNYRPMSHSMHQQFNCHFYLASKIPIQATWNIDTRRVAEGMWQQFGNLCNNPNLTSQNTP